MIQTLYYTAKVKNQDVGGALIFKTKRQPHVLCWSASIGEPGLESCYQRRTVSDLRGQYGSAGEHREHWREGGCRLAGWCVCDADYFFQTQSEWKVSKEKAALSKKQGEGAAQKPQNKLETFLLKKALQRVEDGKLEPLVYKLTDIFFK